ncbi:MAG: OmpA family protein [Bacteroidales bacterium]|nr:OmpA family protein [Candidatus Colimorpha pelethequi]
MVYNPSFESHTDCPRKINAVGVLTVVDAWYQPTKGSADYYNICGSKECNIPKNKLGIQDAYDGEGYCGIYVSQDNYREYLQTQLKEPLVKGATYRLTFRVSLSEYSTGAIATIGGLFTNERITDTTQGILMHRETKRISASVVQTINTFYQPQVVNPKERILDDTKGWQQIEGTFVASGGEEFLSIGNFLSASQSNLIFPDSLENLLPGAYYYIDDIHLECIDYPEVEVTDNPSNEKTTLPIVVGSTIVLKDIYFEFDKNTLLQQSYKELVRLIDLLRENPKMKIEIQGHTDNQGSASYNQRLSEQRAKAVVDYLVRHGIEAKRLSYKGYGKESPIADNATEEGRATNRRVAFKVISK